MNITWCYFSLSLYLSLSHAFCLFFLFSPLIAFFLSFTLSPLSNTLLLCLITLYYSVSLSLTSFFLSVYVCACVSYFPSRHLSAHPFQTLLQYFLFSCLISVSLHLILCISVFYLINEINMV